MGSDITVDDCRVQGAINITEETVEQILSQVDTFIITIVVPIILGLGLLINLLLLIVFLRVPRLRSETDVYLAHLALSDVIYLIVCSARDIWRCVASPLLWDEPFSSSAGCVLYNFAFQTPFAASMAFVTVVSFERYLALCHPIQHLKIRSRRRTYKMVAICWGIGVVFAVLITLNFAKYGVECLRWPEEDTYIGLPSHRAYCTYIFGWTEYISEPLINLPWCIAMIGNVYMYARIIHMLNKRKGVKAEGKSVKANSKAREIRNQVAKMLVVNGTVFFLCQVPFATLNLSAWICQIVGIDSPLDEAFGVHIDWMVLIPLRINTIVNPLIYCAFNSQYRAAFIQAFRCNRRRQGQHSANHPTHVNRYAARSVCSTETDNTKL